MSSIAEVEVSCQEVKDTYEHGDEVARCGFLAKVPVHGLDDVGSLVGTTCLTAEHGPHHRHQQGSRHSLARYVADTEEETVVANEIVVEVATHIACWCQRSVQVEVCVLLLQQEVIRQHRHLNAPSDFQFPLERRLLCGNWIRKLLDDVTADEVDGNQSKQHGQQDEGVEHASVVEDNILGNHDDISPIHKFYGAVVYPGCHSFHLHHGRALILFLHLLQDVHVARSFLELLVEVGSEHQVLVGMDDVSALFVNDKTV